VSGSGPVYGGNGSGTNGGGGGATGGNNTGNTTGNTGGGTSTASLCSGPARRQLCDIYLQLFNREPDEPGMQYWLNLLTQDGNTARLDFPNSCWKHQVVKGTKGSDCGTYLNRFAPRNSYGEIFGWVPSAQCALPPTMGSISYYVPGCFVYPSDAQTACPGSPDPVGPQTAGQRNLCQAYSELFNRAPDADGYMYWLPQLENSSLACVKRSLAYATQALDCAAFRARHGVNAPSISCGGPAQNLGCNQ